MKAYGIPRNWDVGAPDVADIHAYGLKSSIGTWSARGLIANKAAKRQTRRRWKRAARRENQLAIIASMED